MVQHYSCDLARGAVFWELSNPEDVDRIEGLLARTDAMTPRLGTALNASVGGELPFALIAGPYLLESLENARMLASRIAEACAPTGTPFIFTANRSSLGTTRGLELEKGGANSSPVSARTSAARCRPRCIARPIVPAWARQRM